MRRSSRAALTLVEMLVAMAVTLIMMGAVVTMFGNVGNSITGSRAMMEISERLRNCRNVLQRDLGNVTVTMLPSRRPETDEGFFEVVEGLRSDFWPMADWPGASSSNPPTSGDVPFAAQSAAHLLAGDIDDVLMFTARSRSEPYIGSVGGNNAGSLTAEIIYYTAVAPNTPTIIDSQTGNTFQLRTLYRRVLLVNPAAGIVGNALQAYRAANDLSVRFDGTNVVANTLGDLTKRENRYGHVPSGSATGFPFPVLLPGDTNSEIVPHSGSNGREGDDIILTNVLAFDVRVYDPQVPIRVTTSGVATLPSDPGYAISSNTSAGVGGYVDLFFNRYIPTGVQPNSYFSSKGDTAYVTSLPYPTYDTWSMHYEQNGSDENGDGLFDTATNGLDDNSSGPGTGIVDDPTEREAPPPFPHPLRGIQVKIRVYEPDSRQVREVTVVQDFLPQ